MTALLPSAVDPWASIRCTLLAIAAFACVQDAARLPNVLPLSSIAGIRLGLTVEQLRRIRPNAAPVSGGLRESVSGFDVSYLFPLDIGPFESTPMSGAGLSRIAAERVFDDRLKMLRAAVAADSEASASAGADASCRQWRVADGTILERERSFEGARLSIAALLPDRETSARGVGVLQPRLKIELGRSDSPRGPSAVFKGAKCTDLFASAPSPA